METEKFSTTFASDFLIAEAFGIEAVKDTYQRAFKEWRNRYQYITDLCIVTNHLCWYHYEKGNEELSRLYADFYYEVRDWCLDHLKGSEFDYFFRMTD